MSFHLTCVGLSGAQADRLPIWHCLSCRRPTSVAGVATAPILPAHAAPQLPLDIPGRLALLKLSRKVVPRVPRGVREYMARSLASAINKAVDTNTPQAWEKFLRFPYGALSVPTQENEKESPSLTSKVRKPATTYQAAANTDYLFDSN